jgi:hypothetical protein
LAGSSAKPKIHGDAARRAPAAMSIRLWRLIGNSRQTPSSKSVKRLYTINPMPSTTGITVAAVCSENWKIQGAAISAAPTM